MQPRRSFTHNESTPPERLHLRFVLALALIFGAVLLVGLRRHPPADPRPDGKEAPRAQRYENRALWVTQAPAAATPAGGQKEAPSRQALRGNIYDSEGAPIADATVTASTFELAGNLPAVAGVARSDRKGYFELPLPEGSYMLKATHEGYGPSSVNARTGDLVSLLLPRSGAITGHVYDEAHRPVPRFSIEVISATPGHMAAPAPLWSRSFDAPDGAFRVEELPAWAVIVKAMAAGRADAFSPSITVRPAETRTVDLAMSPGCTLDGVVVDGRGDPAAYVLVDAESRMVAGTSTGSLSADLGHQVQSDPAGRFRLEHVPLGAVVVRAYDGNHAVTTVSTDIKGCAALQPVRLVMSNGGSITGTVRDSNGRPLSEARLTVSQRAIGFVAAVSDAEGRFRFDRLPPGKLRLELHHGGQRSLDLVDVKEGQVVNRDLTLAARGHSEIRGRVTASGRSLPNMRVMAVVNRGQHVLDTHYATTDADGNYHIPDLPEGRYLLHVVSSTRSQGVDLKRGGVAILLLDVAQELAQRDDDDDKDDTGWMPVRRPAAPPAQQ